MEIRCKNCGSVCLYEDGDVWTCRYCGSKIEKQTKSDSLDDNVANGQNSAESVETVTQVHQAEGYKLKKGPKSFLAVVSCFVIFSLIFTGIMLAFGVIDAASHSNGQSYSGDEVTNVDDDWFEQRKQESDDWYNSEVERMKRESEQWNREHGLYDNNSTWNWNSMGTGTLNSVSPITLNGGISKVSLGGQYNLSNYICDITNNTGSALNDVEFRLSFDNYGFSVLTESIDARVSQKISFLGSDATSVKLTCTLNGTTYDLSGWINVK